MTPPCGVPSVAGAGARLPALPPSAICRSSVGSTPSVTRWSRKARRWECGIESKYLRCRRPAPSAASATSMKPVRSLAAPHAPIAQAGSRTSRQESPARRRPPAPCTIARCATLSSKVGMPRGRRDAVRLRDVRPAHRRCLVAAGLDAVQQVHRLASRFCRVVRRRHTVDARRTILAGEPPGLLHPFEIDDMVQRGQRHSAPGSSRQFSYPLSFRGQVCGAQGLPPVFPVNGSLRVAPPFPRAGPGRVRFPDVIGSMKALRLPAHAFPAAYWFASGHHAIPPLFVLASSALPRRRRTDPGPGLVQPAPKRRLALAWTRAGSLRFPGDPSCASAPVQDPGRTDDPMAMGGVVDAAPARMTAKAPSKRNDFEADARLQHLLPTLHERRCRHPCKARFRLAGSPLPGGS